MPFHLCQCSSVPLGFRGFIPRISLTQLQRQQRQFVCLYDCVWWIILLFANLCVIQGWGKTINLGVEKPGSQITFPCSDVLAGGKTLTGSLFGGLKAKSDIPILLKRYMDKVSYSFLAYHGLSKTIIQQYNWFDYVASLLFLLLEAQYCVYMYVVC